jgi:hypothetical protein
VTSAALGGASEKLGRFVLYGFTDQAATSLIPLAKSWNRPPTLGKPIDCESSGYIQAERAYRLAAKTSSMSFTLEGSRDRPIHNPCFVIKKWTNQNKCRLEVNGKALVPGTSFRQGITRDTDGTRMLVVWLNLQSTSPAEFTVTSD